MIGGKGPYRYTSYRYIKNPWVHVCGSIKDRETSLCWQAAQWQNRNAPGNYTDVISAGWCRTPFTLQVSCDNLEEKTQTDPGQWGILLGFYKVSSVWESEKLLVGKCWNITGLNEANQSWTQPGSFLGGEAHIMTPELASWSHSLQPNRVLGTLCTNHWDLAVQDMSGTTGEGAQVMAPSLNSLIEQIWTEQMQSNLYLHFQPEPVNCFVGTEWIWQPTNVMIKGRSL